MFTLLRAVDKFKRPVTKRRQMLGPKLHMAERMWVEKHLEVRAPRVDNDPNPSGSVVVGGRRSERFVVALL